MRRRLSALLLILATPLILAAQSSSGDDLETATAPPWVRSIVCPVLYTHEVASQAVMRRFVSGVLAAGYSPTSLATVDAIMSGIADPPRRCIVLTFDDGLRSQYLNAMPVLLDLGVPAVFFVLPGYRDGVHRYMESAEIQALAEAGFEVQAHTCNHPNLPLLARRNLDAFYAELEDCKRLLESMTDQPVNFLAYPSGAFDPTVIEAVERFGFRAAFTTRPAALLRADMPFGLPRIRYDPSEAPATVLARVRSAGG